MIEQQKTNISNEDLAAAFEGESHRRKVRKEKEYRNKSPNKRQRLIFLISGISCSIIGIVLLVVGIIFLNNNSSALSFPKIPSTESEKESYSLLTGEKVADDSMIKAPTYCVQTPNGTDGARPQAGLNEAGVIFEAVAESGITRFAAIYQNPSSGIIGPIRSLRIYYLEWDTPFDCAIVHAGGSGDALEAVSAGSYRDLTEDYSYMYRGTVGERRWNNLFTTSADLAQFSDKIGYKESNIKGFPRMTPTESAKALATGKNGRELEITKPANETNSESLAAVSSVNISFGGLTNFNVNYEYDATSNTYLRSYASGVPHQVYKCPSGDLSGKNPEDMCELVQMAPSVVVAMMVPEHRASDNYHEDINTIGSGTAYIFQNGTVIDATWKKTTKEDQIKFVDSEGAEIKLAPGQTFISAVPNYGSVDY